jgi:hypothetical protein
MANVSYTRVNWEDTPSTNTPISGANLNIMDKGISDCATEITNRQPKTDNNLNTTAKTIAGAINELDSDITGLNTSLGGIKFRVSSGKLQYSTNGSTWTDIGGGAMGELDFSNAQLLSTTAYTTTKSGAIVGVLSRYDGVTLSVDSKIVALAIGADQPCISIPSIASGSSIVLSASNARDIYFVPYK